MAYQGEYFVERHGARAAEHTPPIRKMLERARVKVAVGTDATARVASYNPCVLYWLTTGKTVGGLSMYPQANVLDREDRAAAGRKPIRGSRTREGQEGARLPSASLRTLPCRRLFHGSATISRTSPR
ncbi:hypothetical protein ACTMU2_18915 [Cupriavidus basilensis]